MRMYRVVEMMRHIRRERRLLCAVGNTARGVSKKQASPMSGLEKDRTPAAEGA